MAQDDADGRHTRAASDVGAPSLAGLPVVVREIVAAGRAWRIAAVADQNSLVAAADQLAEFPFGLMLWESAVALADHLAEAPGGLAGQRWLELGAGVGLAGLAAAHLGAEVVQTDHSAEALALARRNALRHGFDGVRHVHADWRVWPDLGTFDAVLGADILYETETYDALLGVLGRCLSPGGRLVLTDPGRAGAASFVARLANVADLAPPSSRRLPSLAPSRPGESVEVTVIEARWR
jgi:predicted nicotinamide N-methyase